MTSLEGLSFFSTLCVIPCCAAQQKEFPREWRRHAMMHFTLLCLLINRHALTLPNFNRAVTLMINAYKYGIGGVMLQGSHLLPFMSRELNPTKQSYSTT